jgi:hypothetical protein
MENESYYAMADETHGMDVKILDVSDLTDIQVTDTIGSDIHEFSIPHNLIYKDNLLYVSYYVDGLYAFDCSDPAHPTLAGFYDTSTEAHVNQRYRGCWGVYPFLPSGNILASDMQTGLWIFSPPALSSPDFGLENKSFQVYPNPSSNAVFVPKELVNEQFVLIDLQGRVVNSGVLQPSLSIDQLTTGVYVLQVITEDAVWSTKVVRK